ncbi:hypothetical protein ACXWTF_13175 [Thiomicrolovo sp. ZZH C-3]
MLKKIATTIVCCLPLMATPGSYPSAETEVQPIQNDTEYRIKTRAEFDEAKKALLSGMGDKGRTSLELGILFLSNIPLDDGTTIKADLVTARRYFKQALSNGASLAAYFIGVSYLREKDPYNAVNALDGELAKQLQSLDRTRVNPSYVSNASLLATTVLDHTNHNVVLLQKAITYLHPVATDYNVATAQFILANLYMALGKEDTANLYLNAACTNPKAPLELAQICGAYSNVETETTCEQRFK